MPIHLTVISHLRKYVPGGRGKADVPFVPGMTVAGLVDRLGLPPASEFLVLVNGRQAAKDQALVDEDQVFIFPPMTGG
ncbi:MAG: MoaD/ThiS family protein [Pseudomonadota bacterium]